MLDCHTRRGTACGLVAAPPRPRPPPSDDPHNTDRLADQPASDMPARRRRRSSRGASGRARGADGDDDTDGHGGSSVYHRALAGAAPCPFWCVALCGCAPVAALLALVLRNLPNGENDHHNSGGVDGDLRLVVAFSLFMSVGGYFVTSLVVPTIARRLLPRVSGVDIGKRGLGGPRDGQPVAESLGIVPGTIFLVCLTLTATFARTVTPDLRLPQPDFNVAIGSICMAVLLGLVDDLVDLKWREKLLVGAVAALPLIGSYSGPTSVILPRQLRFLVARQPDGTGGTVLSPGPGELTWFGELLDRFVEVDRAADGALLDLGMWYLFFIFCLVVFCTNAINIYAGINGIEAGQTYVTACAVAAMNLLELFWRSRTDSLLEGDGLNHLFSLLLMLPFVGTMLGYLRHNWFPARVFGGDVLPYYAGMTLAVSAILGHFSKSLLLLMLPQVVNFLYSLPQLCKIVPIPRHRLPRVDPATGYLRASKVAPGDSRSNMTLLCAAVTLCGGALHERTLCAVLLVFQAACCSGGLFLRYGLGSVFYGWGNVFSHEPSL